MVHTFVHPRRGFFLYVNDLVSDTAGGPESPRAHVAKFYGGHRLICSVLGATKFSEFEID